MNIIPMKSENQLRAEIEAASRDLDTAQAGTDHRIKALQRLAALREQLRKLELDNLRRKNK